MKHFILYKFAITNRMSFINITSFVTLKRFDSDSDFYFCSVFCELFFLSGEIKNTHENSQEYGISEN